MNENIFVHLFTMLLLALINKHTNTFFMNNEQIKQITDLLGKPKYTLTRISKEDILNDAD